MTKLERELADLRILFEPWNTSPHGASIWEPVASDQNSQFKREMIGKACAVIAAGDEALAGTSFTAPQFAEPELAAIAELLAGDPEERIYYEMGSACTRVVASLRATND